MKDRRKKKIDEQKRDKLVKVGIVIITIVFIFIIYKIFNIVVIENEKINLSGQDYYQYFYGLRQDYSGNMEIINDDSGKQLILEDGRKVFLDSSPIYYKDILGKVLFTEKMELVNTDTGNTYKLDEYTNILEESNKMYIKRLKKDKTTVVNNHSFIYDGSDLYFFLEETIIKIGKKKYEVSPLSYAIVNYKENIEIYDYDKDEFIIVDEKLAKSNKVIATNFDEDYTINMSVDSFSTYSSDQLIIKNIDYLPELDY